MYGTPKFSAALAAKISPSGCCMPCNPTGAIAHGILNLDPNISTEVSLSEISTATLCLNLIFLKSSQLALKVVSDQDPDST